MKRSTDIKIAEVSTSKKKRTKKQTAEAPEPEAAENLFKLPFKRTEGYEMRSRLEHAALDVAEGDITLEEVIGAIRNALRDRNLRLADQGAFYNPPKCALKRGEILWTRSCLRLVGLCKSHTFVRATHSYNLPSIPTSYTVLCI